MQVSEKITAQGIRVFRSHFFLVAFVRVEYEGLSEIASILRLCNLGKRKNQFITINMFALYSVNFRLALSMPFAQNLFCALIINDGPSIQLSLKALACRSRQPELPQKVKMSLLFTRSNVQMVLPCLSMSTT